MCGITGVYHFDNNRKVEQLRLKKMTDIIRHRGPDDDGFYFNGNIGMGHRRLSIIDLNTGDQPMYNQDKSISVILNGEIYNYVELREELIEKGHKFFTTLDTEVVIKSYEDGEYIVNLNLMACGLLLSGIIGTSSYSYPAIELGKNHYIILYGIIL